MLAVHPSCKDDKLTTTLRYLVTSILCLLSLLFLTLGFAEGATASALLLGLLNALFWGVIAYGVYTKPHKNSSFALVFLTLSTATGSFYSHLYLTQPLEGRESIFTSLTQWYLAFFLALLTCISTAILYFRSRYLYARHKKEENSQ